MFMHSNRLWLSQTMAGLVLAIALLALPLASTAPAEAAPNAQGAPIFDGCIVNVSHQAAPPFILLGEEVELQIRVDSLCPGIQRNRHIVFALDASTEMTGTPLAEMKQAVKSFIRDLDLAANPGTQVGMVHFNEHARTWCTLTNDPTDASDCIDKLLLSEGSNLERGLTEALNVMRKGRQNIVYPRSLIEAIIVVSSRPFADGCEPVLRRAGITKSQGVAVITVGLGPEADQACLERSASQPRFALRVLNPNDLDRVLTTQALADVLHVKLRSLEILLRLSDEVELLTDSASPAAHIEYFPQEVLWQRMFVGSSTFTTTVRVKPRHGGVRNIGLNSEVRLRDLFSRNQTLPLPPAKVNVFRRPVALP